MANTTNVLGSERPYKPSWIDRFKIWVGKLPLRAWIFYAAFGIVLIVIQVLFLGLEGGLQSVALLPVIIFNGFFTPFLLALIHFLDHQAVMALNSMRSTLTVTEPELNRLQYTLSNMPSGTALFAGLTMVVLAVLMERLWVTPLSYAALEQLPLFTIVFQIVDKSSAFLFGALIYHTIRQLRLVNRILLNYCRINLFHLRPLQSFSRLTAFTAVGLLVGVYGWVLINPELLTDPVILGFAVLITLAAIAVFVWPLLGIHRLMKMEKEKMLDALDLRFEEVFAKFNHGLSAEDEAAMGRINGLISSLDIQNKKITAIPTWPWSPETGRFALGAIALPLILTILQFLAMRALD
jgi:hypothetical protein